MWWRQYGFIVQVVAGIALLIIIMVLWSRHNHHQQEVGAQACQNLNDLATIDTLSKALERSETQRANLETELDFLRRQRIDVPTPTVRLCRYSPPASAQLPATEGSAPAAAGPLPPTGQPDSGPGPDIGPALFALLDQADEIVAHCRAEGH